MNSWARVNEFRVALREERRLKENIDYSLTLKYGYLHVLCAGVYREAIVEVAARFGLEMSGIYTY
jgi:hypothetical protein